MGNTSLRWMMLGSLLWAISAGAALAVIRTVDDDPETLPDFSSVQLAINASSSGDVVMVNCGFYAENIAMKDGVDVLGAGAGCTTLDGTSSGTVVTFQAVGSGTELSGFTIQNGRNRQGGGIVLFGNSGPTISRNIIRDNRAVIEGGFFGYGGGISSDFSSPTISNNLLVANSAERSGGGLDMYKGSPEVVNNTIVGNESSRPGDLEGIGGGVYGLRSEPTLTSNIIYDNTSEGGGGGIELVESVTYAVTFNDLFQNAPKDWHCLDDFASNDPCANPEFPPGPGNVSVDPLLEGVGQGAARYCPRSNSPMLDAGAVTSPSEPVDLLGRPRVQDGDLDGMSKVDLGSCETDEVSRLLVHGSGLITWDASVNGSVNYNLYRGDLNLLLSSCDIDCVYTQVGGEALQSCDVPSPSWTDTDEPLFNGAYFYLVTAEDVVEGTLGWMGSNLRDNDNPCP